MNQQRPKDLPSGSPTVPEAPSSAPSRQRDILGRGGGVKETKNAHSLLLCPDPLATSQDNLHLTSPAPLARPSSTIRSGAASPHESGHSIPSHPLDSFTDCLYGVILQSEEVQTCTMSYLLLGMVAYAFNHNTQEAKVGRSLVS